MRARALLESMLNPSRYILFAGFFYVYSRLLNPSFADSCCYLCLFIGCDALDAISNSLLNIFDHAIRETLSCR